MREYSAGCGELMAALIEVHSIVIVLLPWQPLRLSSFVFSLMKRGLLLLLLDFLLDWVLLSSLGFLSEVGPLAPIWAFFVKSLLDKMPFAYRSTGLYVMLVQSAVQLLVEPAVREE